MSKKLVYNYINNVFKRPSDECNYYSAVDAFLIGIFVRRDFVSVFFAA